MGQEPVTCAGDKMWGNPALATLMVTNPDPQDLTHSSETGFHPFQWWGPHAPITSQ
jgi:hypothetical protein